MTVHPPPTVALLPLDERPVTSALPVMVGAVAGSAVLLPPASALPRLRVAGDLEHLSDWLVTSSRRADAAVVSLEMLGLGGLVPSRIGTETLAAVLNRWDVLRRLSVPIHASSVVTRTPNADDDTEEPHYFAQHGGALHAAAASLALNGGVPPGTDATAMADFLRRRMRNHTLNLAALGLVSDRTLATLVLGADDTSAAALGTAEQGWLRRWRDWLDLGLDVLTYPGADEISAALVVRAMVRHFGGSALRVAVQAASGLDRVAPYENVSVLETARQQVCATGAEPAEPGATGDLDLVVHCPAVPGADQAIGPPQVGDPQAAWATAQLVGQLVSGNRRVAVADCAYPNGADPALIATLREVLGGRWETLVGYAGWNTAGNSIGTAVAHGLAYVLGERHGCLDEAAHARLLRHRLLEDWGWMSSARTVVRAEIASDPTRHDHIKAGSGVEDRARALLTQRLDELGQGWVVSDVSFPWRRTFEVDFSVTPAVPEPRDGRTTGQPT